MLTGIDHLVVVIADLEAAIKDYRAMGFTVVPGGRHPTGTENALMAFADGSYLELIAFHRRNEEHRWWRRHEQGGGLVDYCLGTGDIAADTETLRRAGVAMGELFPLSRVRPDGVKLSWSLSIPKDLQGVAPFLIADETPRAERVPQETRHANGVEGVALLTIAVHDAAAPRRWYSMLGGTVEEVRSDHLQAAGLRVTIGANACAFLAPTAPESPLASLLAERGPAPFSIAFACGGKAPHFDPARSWRARLAAQEP